MAWTETANSRRMRELVLEWTSDGSENVSEQTPAPISGLVLGARFIPGDTTPTDLYDFTIVTEDGDDVLGGNGANCPAASAEFRECLNSSGLPDLIPVVQQRLTATGSNCGAAKTGTIRLIIVDTQ